MFFEVLLNPDLYKVQSKCLSVAFWDISGFSDLCNRLIDKPIVIVSLLKGYFNEANKVIHLHGGILDKFIGDGIMAYFGYSDKSGNCGAKEAINAALELKDIFPQILSEQGKDHNVDKPNINLKCGINTGSVLFGLLETDYRNQITVTGSTVNFASRLEGKGENDQIIVSKETIEKTDKEFTFSQLDLNIQSYGNVIAFEITGKNLLQSIRRE